MESLEFGGEFFGTKHSLRFFCLRVGLNRPLALSNHVVSSDHSSATEKLENGASHQCRPKHGPSRRAAAMIFLFRSN